mmetsp:Transcript_2997/g.5290  ORF Transcript_2997/g.5290 Transcript_2997/m.5290 type:complete len:611 (-) Transcript_2997:651-2483(-)|eukprot:CAMPEP_0182443346 /NCGR_PEP_ID=MMETSP1172-20130603/2109_1 /TAXON_ID=708627 /ORGANISM="Timspurckia oligopyrenoides, Strain CCMP3278" /LENGTH=610 /DNA_ID=CAMNT_0024638603 /DNA_START=237 /DNA_END=2069 /DNA_ORIENTATION=+
MRYSKWVVIDGQSEISATVGLKTGGGGGLNVGLNTSKNSSGSGGMLSGLFGKGSSGNAGPIRRSLSRSNAVDAGKQDSDPSVSNHSSGSVSAGKLRRLSLSMLSHSITFSKLDSVKKPLWSVPIEELGVDFVDESELLMGISVAIEGKNGKSEQKKIELTFSSHDELIRWVAAFRQARIILLQKNEARKKAREEAELEKLKKEKMVSDDDEPVKDEPEEDPELSGTSRLWPAEVASEEDDTESVHRQKLQGRANILEEERNVRLKYKDNLRIEQFYEIGEEIGEGTFGKVYSGIDRLTKAQFAVKHMVERAGEEQYLKAEIELVAALAPHKHVLYAYDIFESYKEYFVVMEFMPHGDLFEIVDKETKISEARAVQIMKELFLAVKHLHSNRIIHRDIKLDNILLRYSDKTLQWPPSLRLGDFSFAIQLEPRVDVVTENSFVGTLLYLAPESIKTKDYSFGADIWACGIVLFMLLAGKFPFWGDGDHQYLRAVVMDPLKFPAEDWSGVSKEAKALLRKMLEKDPADRITIDECLKHPWLKVAESQIPPTEPSKATAKASTKGGGKGLLGAKPQRAKNVSRMRKSLERFVPQLVAQAEAEQKKTSSANGSQT